MKYPHFSTFHVFAVTADALAGVRPARRACGQRSASAAVARLTPRPSRAGAAHSRATRAACRHLPHHITTSRRSRYGAHVSGVFGQVRCCVFILTHMPVFISCHVTREAWHESQKVIRTVAEKEGL